VFSCKECGSELGFQNWKPEFHRLDVFSIPFWNWKPIKRTPRPQLTYPSLNSEVKTSVLLSIEKPSRGELVSSPPATPASLDDAEPTPPRRAGNALPPSLSPTLSLFGQHSLPLAPIFPASPSPGCPSPRWKPNPSGRRRLRGGRWLHGGRRRLRGRSWCSLGVSSPLSVAAARGGRRLCVTARRSTDFLHFDFADN
jgi:hypothetical protein